MNTELIYKRMLKKEIIYCFIGFFILVALSGCNQKPMSVGTEGTIVIVADQLDRPVIRPVLEKKFGRIIHTPQPEPYFNIYWVDAQSLSEQTTAPLILLSASLDGEGPTADLLRRMLTPEVSEGVNSGEFAIFRRGNPWARKQLLLVLLGRDRRELGANAVQWSDSLYNWAVEFERERVSNQVFRRGEQKELELELQDEFGFHIRIQHDYLIAQKNDSSKFVRLLRHYPERWIMVAWGELDNDSLFTPQFIYEQRRTLGEAFLDPVMTYDDRWSWQRTTLGNYDTILINGLWATLDPTGGGPFFCYGLWISDRKRYYIIDGAVFAPGETKMSYLWQLETIVHSFNPDPKM